MSRRPNVIVILSDDHGYADRSALGVHDNVHTPALDRLAAEGVSCDNAYVAAPICSPSRAGLMSGRYPLSFGTTWFDNSRLPDDSPTLAERFKERGYTTGYFGKVHYGPEQLGDHACPPHHGFDETRYGLAGQSQGRLHYLRHSRAEYEARGEAGWRMGTQPLLEGDDEYETEDFLTWDLGQRARDFVTGHAGDANPFFLMLAFNAVHNFCWQLPEAERRKRGLSEYHDWDPETRSYFDWYDDVVAPNLDKGREYYLAQLELMDAEIGRLMDTVDANGLREDTIVVYLTDNGGSHCNHGDNTPLAGSKYTLFEGGIRVPFLVRWPGGGVPAGEHRDGLISALDLYPSLLAAAGGDPGDGHGVDQWAMLRGETDAGHEALHWDCGFQYATRSGAWKLRYADGESDEVRGLLQYEHTDLGAGLFLYNLDDDPAETRNLADAHPDKLAELQRLRHDWRATMLS
ncbi:sulfatase family protein [Stackebrandtia nassauensis]|uniref:Sulfatase n=1 Tax=Stackebrandtia nassauensis (strain DSM 44728 / CIP 108903 / NRRL B-16338 / NBRC 102104 / LLR-40K-21) TaxID=446470 RepID=D3Q0T8_STANL|nr:sulfatase-like hydrolase/transferase [Stackebrandtia nassauensis]ADD43688.1 sulfatase [Stackebrandtia nassauensis DSM 44728]